MLVIGKVVKESLTQKAVALDFFKTHLPDAILKQFDLSTLEITKRSYITTDLKVLHEDIVYRCNLNTGELGYIPILCLTRDQSNSYENMAHRFLEYIFNVVGEYLKEGHPYFPIIYPLCIYQHEPSFYSDSPPDIDGKFKAIELFRILRLKPFNLLKFARHSVSDLEEYNVSAMMEILLKIKAYLRVIVCTVRQDELQAEIEVLKSRLRQ